MTTVSVEAAAVTRRQFRWPLGVDMALANDVEDQGQSLNTGTVEVVVNVHAESNRLRRGERGLDPGNNERM